MTASHFPLSLRGRFSGRVRRAASLALLGTLASIASALPAPPKRPLPEWFRREGIVMAGNWESVYYRIRSGNPEPEADREAWLATIGEAYTEATARKLKDAGINFVMLPIYKGFGLATERPQME